MTLKNVNLKCKYLYLPFDIEGSAILAQTNITVIEGENSTLNCHVWGIPVPSVWAEVRTRDRTEGNIRSLINVSISDAVEYKCKASNFCGNDSKTTFLIFNCKWRTNDKIKSNYSQYFMFCICLYCSLLVLHITFCNSMQNTVRTKTL